MKKSFLTLVCAMALAVSTASAATKSRAKTYTGVIKANPLGLALGYFNAQYELPVGPSAGLNINGSFYSYGSGFFKASGFGAGGMYRFYSKGKGKNLNSFYYGPFLNFASITWKYEYDDIYFGGTYSSKASLFAIAPGFGLGRQWIFNGGFTLDVGGGLQYYIAGDIVFKDSNGTEISALAIPSAFQGIWPALWFSLGYAFGK